MTDMGREETGKDPTVPPPGSIWTGSDWVAPSASPPKKGTSAGLVLAVVIGILLLVMVGCSVVLMNSKGDPAAPPCPKSTATSLGGSFQEGFNNGLTGCQ